MRHKVGWQRVFAYVGQWRISAGLSYPTGDEAFQRKAAQAMQDSLGSDHSANLPF